MLDKFFTQEFYKEAAIKKMVSFRENDNACFEIRGELMDSKTKAKLLNNIAFLRRRYTGQEALPTIKVVRLV